MDRSEESDSGWDLIIVNNNPWFRLGFKEMWSYRDLLVLLIRRDFVSFYKQTVLGPLWFFIQPLFTVGIYVFLFGQVANLSTDDIPEPLFYLVGIMAWNYFSDCFKRTSTVLIDNSSIFGKVYFPRLIIPISIVVSSLIRYFFQLILLLVFCIYFMIQGYQFNLSWSVLLFPILMLLMAIQGMGLGMMVSSLTVKYRDLAFLVTFGLQLAMYATTVVYPLSSLSGNVKLVISLHPLTYIIEGMRLVLFGQGEFDLNALFYLLIISMLFLIIGIIMFNRSERNFIDSI